MCLQEAACGWQPTAFTRRASAQWGCQQGSEARKALTRQSAGAAADLGVLCQDARLSTTTTLAGSPQPAQVEQHEWADAAQLANQALAVAVGLQVQPHAGAIALELLQQGISVNSINLCTQQYMQPCEDESRSLEVWLWQGPTRKIIIHATSSAALQQSSESMQSLPCSSSLSSG